MATIPLPDNLLSRLTRVYVDARTADIDGKTVNYNRLVLSGTVKGKDFNIETKIEQKDITLLGLSDSESERQALGVFNINSSE